MKKRGVFFSLDALIALIIIVIVVLIAFPLQKKQIIGTEIHYDTLATLSTLKIGEIDDPAVEFLRSSGFIKNPEKSVLEQIGEFYITDEQKAKDIAASIFQNLETNHNIGIWLGNTLIASKNKTAFETSEKIDTARQIISGISLAGNSSLTGFSAQAYLSNAQRTSYTYFGGYVGDGNITAVIEYNGTATGGEIEAVISEPYEILINDVSIGTFPASTDDFTPTNHVFIPLQLANFASGENFVEIRSAPGAGILHIAGGFIKLRYSTNVKYAQTTRYKFPEINGFVNLYDSFFVPSEPASISLNIHYISENIPIFLTIGNKTIFTSQSVGESIITMDNSQLSLLLDYAELDGKTIPLRLGLENASFVINKSTGVDVFSVTDLSGSMSGSKITNAKEATHVLKAIILGINKSRVGLVGYEDTVLDSDFHPLSINNNTMNNIINNVWNADGQTCICCGINRAIQGFQDGGIGAGGGTISIRVAAGNDDAEECIPSGTMSLSSTDLELISDTGACSGGNQEVGMRFQNILIPQGSTINSAYIEFETDETNSGSTSLVFYAQDIDNAPSFSSSNSDISNRIKTSSSVSWNNIPSWSIISEKHQTPDISSIIQEVIDRPSWTSGNSLAIITTGSGKRTAEAYNGESANAPLLVIEYQSALCGNGIIESGEECDDGNNNDGDGCTSICISEDKLKSMVVMSDGQANVQCPEQNTGSASQDAIQAACDAFQDNGIRVHAVGFGSTADETTLQAIATCGNGTYTFSNIDQIAETYKQLAEDIIAATYYEQTVIPSGNLYSKLFSDSYIDFDFISQQAIPGLILTNEQPFTTTTSGSFNLPASAQILETQAISYSGPRWTKTVTANSNTTFNLDDYGDDYLQLGDPYAVNIPNSLIIQGTNTINITTGLDPIDTQPSSLSGKIIYTFVKNVSSFSSIAGKANGCKWHIQFEDDTEIEASIPTSYVGSNECYYNTTLPFGATQRFDQNDVIQSAAFNLLKELDLDTPQNWKIDIPFTQQDLEISSSEISGIPFTWSTEVQVRIWS